jgi:hypothetical protein
MTPPRDPDDDLPGTPEDAAEKPGDTPADGGEPSEEDAAWLAIVQNYGERADLSDLDDAPENDSHDQPGRAQVPPSPRGLDPEEQPDEQPDDEPEARFVPPPPPPLPRPAPPRMLAWIGLFGVPTFVLLCVVTGLDLPAWLGLVLMVWFVGGFVYLVASMRPGADDDYDDGAVL